jgi:endo-1,4-beta-xylanase
MSRISLASITTRFALAATLLLPALAAAQPDTLRKLADLRGIRVGAAVTFPGSNTAEYQRQLRASFNTMVCENAMKFQNLSSSRNTATGGGNYNFGPADAIVSFADSNGMKMRGHTFVWHSQAATWFTNLSGAAASRDTTLKIMRMHIDTLGKRYKGKILEWDVVNEGINQSGGTSPNYRTSSPWYRIGADYFDSAFVIAQRTDTGARLMYNDFGAEGATGAQGAKSQNVYDLVSGLKARGVPIHGVGLQSHFSLTDHDTAAIGQNMRRLAALGLTISMTEIDIQTSNTTQNWETQKQKYKGLMKLCLSVPACQAYIPWGLNDAQSWRGASATALLFTGTTTITPKPAYWGVVEALEEGSTQTSTPSAPWNALAVQGIAGGSANVSWNAPWTDGRSPITGYKVTAVSDSTKTCTTTGARSCTISGLANGTYRFIVSATNAVGTSGTSPYSTPVTIGSVGIKGQISRLEVGRFTGDYAYALPASAAAQADAVTMTILDASGRKVWEKTVRPTGADLQLAWDGATLSGARAPTGMYVARVRATADGATQETVRRSVRLRD